MPGVVFDFPVPKKGDNKGPETKGKDDAEESTESEDSSMSAEELGQNAIDALEAKDAKAFCLAVRKCAEYEAAE